MAIDFSVENHVALITLNRPERLNALDAEHYRALSEAWIRVRDDAEIRVAIVTGAGEKSFSTGADLKSFANNPAPLSEMWLTGDAINAETAARWGLINCVVPADKLLETAKSYANRIAANAPLAVQAAKELALRGDEMDLVTGLRVEQMWNRILRVTDDAKEGPLAFAEKRPARFQGR